MPAHEQTRTGVVLNRPPSGGSIEAAGRLPPALRAARCCGLPDVGPRPPPPVEGVALPRCRRSGSPSRHVAKGERGDSQMGHEGGKSSITAVFLTILGVCMSFVCFAPLCAPVCGAHNRALSVTAPRFTSLSGPAHIAGLQPGPCAGFFFALTSKMHRRFT